MIEAARTRILNAYLVEFAGKNMTAADMAWALNRTIRSSSGYPFAADSVVALLAGLGLTAAPETVN